MLLFEKAVLALILSVSVGVDALMALPRPKQVSTLTAIAWSSDGHYLATGDDTGNVVCWDVGSGQSVWEWQGSANGVYKLYFDSRRRAFLVLEKFGDVVFIRDKSGEVILDLKLEFGERDKGFVAALATAGFDDDSETLALGGNLLSVVHVLNLSKIPDVPAKQSLPLGSMIGWLHPPSIEGSENSSLIVWIARPQKNEAEIEDLPVGVTDDDPLVDLSVCKGGTVQLGITKAGWLVAWDFKMDSSDKWKYRRQVISHPEEANYLLDVMCGLDGVAVTTGTTGKYGTIQFWNRIDGVMTDYRDTGSSSLIELGATFSSDGKLLVTNGDISYLFWKVKSGKLTQYARMYHAGSMPRNEVRDNLAFRPGSHMLALADGSAVLIVDADTGDFKCLSKNCERTAWRVDRGDLR
jgi:WD40 repeat protein